MRKFAFVILLLIPLIGFGQAEKHYRSIIVDSLKALNGGRVDVKDTLLLDSLAVYNTDLSSQYTSRSLVDSAFVGTAISASGGNTIYSADDDLAGNRTVTMGANSLTFSGNQTTFKGINAAGISDVVLFEDNVGTDLFTIQNDGNIAVGANTFAAVTGTGNLHLTGDNATLRIGNASGENVALWINSTLCHFGTLSNTEIQWRTNNTVRGKFTADGSFSVGTGPGDVDARLHIKGADASAVNFALLVENTTPASLFSVRNDGLTTIHKALSLTPVSVTMGAGVTNIAISSASMILTGDAGSNNLNTLSGATAGSIIILKFLDALITITDDNSGTINTINMPSNFVSAANSTLMLWSDGTSWQQLSRSFN